MRTLPDAPHLLVAARVTTKALVPTSAMLRTLKLPMLLSAARAEVGLHAGTVRTPAGPISRPFEQLNQFNAANGPEKVCTVLYALRESQEGCHNHPTEDGSQNGGCKMSHGRAVGQQDGTIEHLRGGWGSVMRKRRRGP